MQMFRKLTQQRWNLFDYALGLWLMPLDWIWQGVGRLLGWNQLPAVTLGLFAVIVYVVSIQRLSKSQPLFKQELKGWGPIASLMRKRPTGLSEQDLRVSKPINVPTRPCFWQAG